MPLLAIENCVPQVRTGHSTELIRAAREGELDLVMVDSEPPAQLRHGLAVELITKTRLVAVAAPYVTPSGTWEELSLIQYRENVTLRWDVESFLERHGLTPRVSAHSDDALFMIEAASRSGCVVVVAETLARPAIDAGRLAVIAEVPSHHAGIYAVYADAAAAGLTRDALETLIKHVKVVAR
jgi:DNA-binding transcriptional LysR family regulator